MAARVEEEEVLIRSLDEMLHRTSVSAGIAFVDISFADIKKAFQTI